MSTNIFNDSASANIGPRLTNVKNQTINSSKMLVYDSNQRVSQIDFNTSITPIFNQNSLDALKTLLLDNTEEAIVYTANSSDIMEFHTGLAGGAPSSSNLRMEITNTDTKIKNKLIVDGGIETNSVKTLSITAAANDHGFYLYNNPTSSPTPPVKQYYFRFIPDASNFVQTESNYITFTPVNSGAIGFQVDHNTATQQVTSNYNFRINVPNTNDYALYVAPNNNQVCLYSGKQYVGREPSGLLVQGFFEASDANQDRCALKINNYSNLGYRPLCINSANQSKVIFCSQDLHSSDSQNFIVDGEALFTTNVSTHGDLKTYHIYPDIVESGSPLWATSIYSLGQDERRWLDIYSVNAPTHGSDRNLKKDIKPLDFNSLDTILKLDPVLFKWKTNESNRNHIGFVAQDIEKIPELRNTGFYCKSKKGSTMSLRSAELIPVLVGGIQQLNDKLNDKHDKLKELITELLDKHQDLFNQKVKEDDPFENLKLLITENSIDKPVGDDELPKLNKEKLVDLERKIQILDDSKNEHKCGELTILKEDLEELCQSKDALEQELFKFKTQNDILEQRIIELENIDYHQQPVEPAPAVDNNQLVLLKNRIDILEERDMLDDSDATQTSQIDIIMSRLNLLESENKKLKNKVAKQTTIINKLISK